MKQKGTNTRPAIPKALFLSAWLLCGIAAGAATRPAHAQGTPPPTLPIPTTWKGLQIQAGVATSTSGTANTSYYHRVIYKENMLSKKGDPVKQTDRLSQFLNPDSGKLTDATPNRFDLNFINGAGEVVSDTLNALGIKDFKVGAIGVPSFRGVARVAGTLDAKQTNFALGLETDPYHLPSKALRRQFANWLVLGVNAEHQHRAAALGKNVTNGTLTYRTFIGQAKWGYYPREKQLGYSREDLLAAVDPALDPVPPAKPEDVLIKYGPATRRDTGNAQLNGFLLLQATRTTPGPGGVRLPGTPGPFADRAAFEAWITGEFELQSKANSLEPKSAVWLESSGWYAFAGDTDGQQRGKALVAAILTLYRSYDKKNLSFYQLRYEAGFDRAAPDARINRVTASLGLTF